MAAVARTREPFNWPLFLVLWAAALAGILANVPYLRWLLAHNPKVPHVPLFLFVVNQVVGNGLLVGLVMVLGMRCARPLHLGAPILEDRLAGRSSAGPRLREIIGPAVLIGSAVAIVITASDLWIFLPRLPHLHQVGTPPVWAGFLGAFYGAIDEELLLRLGAFSIVAWLLWRIDPSPKGPGALVLWETNFVVAVLFGLAHLPATAQVLPLTPLVASRALVLNGLASLAFGYQYWRHGLEAAMITHFTTDIAADIFANIL
jgi:Type II CAAX prenyl endopeptidase Rce1-like